MESFEPSIDTILLDKIEQLEIENATTKTTDTRLITRRRIIKSRNSRFTKCISRNNNDYNTIGVLFYVKILKGESVKYVCIN